MREEARRLILLVDEATWWEDEKYKKEVSGTHKDTTEIDDTLTNISNMQKKADEHMAILSAHLAIAEEKINSAVVVTQNLQDRMDYKEDKAKRAVWELIEEHGRDLHWDEMVQAYKDRQVKKDMKADGEMNYLMMKRYNNEVEEQKERIHEWIRGLRGRVSANISYVQHQDEILQHAYNVLKNDEYLHFQDRYSKAIHLKDKVGEEVMTSASVAVRVQHADNVIASQQTQMEDTVATANRVFNGVDALDKLIGEDHLADVEAMDKIEEKYEALKSRMSMLITSLTTVQSAMKEEQAAHSALKTEEDETMAKLKDKVEKLKPDLQSILDLDGVIKALQAGTQSNINDASVTGLCLALLYCILCISCLEIFAFRYMSLCQLIVVGCNACLRRTCRVDAAVSSSKRDSAASPEATITDCLWKLQTHFDGVKAAQDQLGVDFSSLADKVGLLNHSITEDEKFVHANGYMSSYSDIESLIDPVKLQINEVESLHGMLNTTKDEMNTWSEALQGQVALMQTERTQWKDLSAQADAQITAKVNNTISLEQSGIAGMFSGLKKIGDQVQEAKDFRESSLAVHNQLRQELAETTQSLEDIDKKFSDLFTALSVKIALLSNATEGLASPEDIKVGVDRVDIQNQETLDNSQNTQPEVDYVKEREASEVSRLNRLEERLKTVRAAVNMAIMRAKEMLHRHPNLFERVSCVCYDGDKLNGKCIAGSMDDESTCDLCPEGSYCTRGVEYKCKTNCPGGMVLKGVCPAGSVSDVTTCVPSPEGFYSETGVATPCKTTCDPGFELRGVCLVGSSTDTKHCEKCPAGFSCTDGQTHECKTSCEAGLVLTGMCTLGSASDVITCEPSPVGHYSEIGVAIPCKPTCEDGKFLEDECPVGSTSDTSKCAECPEGSYCKGGKAIPCKTTCEAGEELTGTCPASSTEDVTVCMRCPEGSFCQDGKAIPCSTTCDAGKYLEGHCLKGSTEDTTKCRTCKSDNYCVDGVMHPCKSECEKGYTLEGRCERGSATDTTVCTGCPEDFYCESWYKFECKRRCWEGKILKGKCEVGSFKDTTTCDACPAGNYCKRGLSFPCNTECPDGKLLKGECNEGSFSDTTSCVPCTAGSFCKDGKEEPCKVTCPDGQLLQGFCRAGSTTDQTECVPCPVGSFCVDGKAQECVHSCPNGQTLVGSCEEGSSTAITHCEACPAGSFCRDERVEACKTTCPAGQYLEGQCDAGSSKDKTECKPCLEGSFCVDGKAETCKETCPAGQKFNGECKTGSTEDFTTCDPCPAGSFCTDGNVFACKTELSCGLGQQFVGECAEGSVSDTTSCDPCPPGFYCRNGAARPCRTIIDCADGHKLDGSCPAGSSMNTVCKPCRAGVFCVNGEETPCRVSCDAGLVLEGFCGSGSPIDSTKCIPAPKGSYAADGLAIPCLTSCEAGKLLTGTCPERSTADGMTCVACPEGLWCENGFAEPCTTECRNGKVISGSCPEGSGSDTVVCNPCPAGSFCSNNQVFPCKSECPDGKFLDGECSPGSTEDTSHCTPCPSGVFCKGGERTACTSTCADGQELQGFCSAGSTDDTVSCAPCPAGSFCRGGVATACKTTCDDGEEFKGTCKTGSPTDTTTCDICPAGFYCQDGLKAQCKKSCDPDFEMVGACAPGSVTDTVKCESGNTPAPFFVEWWSHRTGADGVNEQLNGVATANLGAETRFTGAAGSTGFVEGRIKMPLHGGKWNLQFYAFWPGYDKNAPADTAHPTYPEQGWGKPKTDTITAIINGKKIEMPGPTDNKGKAKLPGRVFFFQDFVGDELTYRFDFTSTTAEPSARPFIVAGEVTILRDGTTGDEGAGYVAGKGMLTGFFVDAIDGKKIRKQKPTDDGKSRCHYYCCYYY